MTLNGIDIPGIGGPINISVPGFPNVSVPSAPALPSLPALPSSGSLLPLPVNPAMSAVSTAPTSPVTPVYDGSFLDNLLTNWLNPLMATGQSAVTNPGGFVKTGVAGDVQAVQKATGTGSEIQHYAILVGAGLVVAIGILGLVLPQGAPIPVPV